MDRRQGKRLRLPAGRLLLSVVTEACVTCAHNYGVVEALQGLKIDVKPMGVPLSERLQADWKVITF